MLPTEAPGGARRYGIPGPGSGALGAVGGPQRGIDKPKLFWFVLESSFKGGPEPAGLETSNSCFGGGMICWYLRLSLALVSYARSSFQLFGTP